MTRDRAMEALAERALEGIDEDFGYYPGYRAAQAKGVLCRGTFRAWKEVVPLTRAPHLQPGAETRVTARFSNFTANPLRHDGALDVRGMATGFHLDGGAQTDIVCLRMSRFLVGTARQFLLFERAIARNPFDDLPRPTPWFLIYTATGRLPRDLLIRQVTPLCRVASYAGCRYNSLHAFGWVDAAGDRRHVRYSWVPCVAEQKLHRRRALRRDPDFLRADLAARMAHAPVRFRLEVTLAGRGDNTSDASVKWPKDRERIVLGELELTEPGAWETAGGAELRFDPARVTDGIELPERDDLLMLRKHVYSLSARRRIGCPAAGGGAQGASPGAPAAQPPPPPARAEPVERPRYAHPHGVKICYETSARPGRPLLLIMGFACSMIWWHRDFRAMLERRGFHLIRFDNRDSGRSSHDFPKVGWLRGTLGRRNPPYTVDDMAADAAGVLEAAGVEAAHVMGVSLGGMIAQALAINHPQRVTSLTTISATPLWHNPGTRRGPKLGLALEVALPRPTEPEERWTKSSLKLWRRLNAKHFPFEEEHVRGLLRQAWEWDGGADTMANRRQTMAVRVSADRTEGLRGLGVPTLVIHGSDDPLVRVACGYDTWKVVDGAKLIVIKGMGHYTPHPSWPIVADGVTKLALAAEQAAGS